MKRVVILLATVAISACNNANSSGAMGVVSASLTLPVSAQLSPLFLPITVRNSIVCPAAPAFTTRFELIVLTHRGISVSVETVTLRLIDGTSRGPAIIFPGSQLRQMFGSTLVRDARAFPFETAFGCGRTFARSLTAEVLLVDAARRATTVMVAGSFQ